jgi:zinc protease
LTGPARKLRAGSIGSSSREAFMPIRPLLRIVVLSLVGCLAVAAPAAAKVFSPTTFKLANGLEVVVITNMRAPIVTHMVWYHAGAADEPRGKSGIAHYLEHLMFKGTDQIKPGEFSRVIARNGGRDNAFTTHDYTGYFQNVASDRLPLVMRMEADRMANLRLTEEVARPELDVVLEERRMRTDNDPSSQLYEQAQAALFVHHPYGIPVIGWEPEIHALDYEDALAFYRTWYAPNNATLVIAGAVTADVVKPLAEQYYGPIPARPVPARVRVTEPEHVAAVRLEMTSNRVRQPSWSRRYVAPSHHAGDTQRAYALEVLAEILGGGETSRLNRALVVDQQVAASAGADYEGTALDLGSFAIYASPPPGGEIAALEHAVEAEVRHVCEDGVTDDELARAKLRLQAATIYALDSLSTGARTIGTALSTGSTVEDVEAWPDRIGAVTTEQIRDAARAVLKDDTAVTSLLKPARTS